jgi:diguanylate cyclase (GGDEF)-like protein
VGWSRRWFSQARADYQERTKAEAALLASEQKYHHLFDHMAEGMAVCQAVLNASGQVTDWEVLSVNRAFEQITALTREQSVGHLGSELINTQSQLAPFLARLDRVVTYGETQELTAQLKTSQKWVRLTGTQLPGGHVAVVFTDISAEHRAVEAERDQRRMAEGLRDIAAALTSTLSLEDVLDRIMVNIQTIASYDAINIMLIDHGRVRAVRHQGYGERGLTDYIEGFNRRVEDVPSMNWMVQNHKALVFSDTESSPSWLVFPPTSWIRSYAGIPISRRGEIIGFINLNSATADFFQPEFIDQLQPFADQAALAIENARAYESLQKGLGRLAILNSASAHLNKLMDLDVVLQVTVDIIAQALEVDRVYLHLYDDARRLTTPAMYGLDQAPALVCEPVTEYLQEMQGPLLVQNGDPDPLPGGIRAQMSGAGIEVLLFLPLRVGEALTGVLECSMGMSGRYLAQEDVDLAMSVAELAAVRIEQARTYEVERKQVSALALLHASSLDISMSHNQPDLLKTIVQRAAWLMNANGGTLYLRGPENTQLTCIISHDFALNEEGSVVKFGDGAAGKVAESGKALVVDDYSTWEYCNPALRQVGLNFGLLTVPVIWQNKVTGVVQLYRNHPAEHFTTQDIELLTLFCGQVAVSLENARLYTEIQQVAVRDALTGLYNRRGLFEVGERELTRAKRYSRPLSACLLDIDHFKKINDTYGHLVGDEVLAWLGGLLAKNLRSMDVVGRYGGEEFIVLAIESEPGAAHALAERLCRTVCARPAPTSAGDVVVTVSIGVASLSEEVLDIGGLLHSADRALYQAKACGRNQVRYFGQDPAG